MNISRKDAFGGFRELRELANEQQPIGDDAFRTTLVARRMLDVAGETWKVS
jgi:hypothetical protein